MGFISDFFVGIKALLNDYSESRTRDTCISIYNKAKNARPNKSERDYLKIVLLTKPPFDYQLDNIIDSILDEDCSNIEELAKHIGSLSKSTYLWESRERNLQIDRIKSELKARNESFFKEFWKQ